MKLFLHELLKSIENPVSSIENRVSSIEQLSSFLYNCRGASTNQPFIMQNEPNFLDALMNVSNVITKYYENNSNWTLGENKPNSKPIQSQFKAKTNPIQSQLKPKQTQFKPKTNPIPPPSVFCRPSSVLRPLSSVFSPLSSVLCLQSSAFCPPSSVVRPLSPVSTKKAVVLNMIMWAIRHIPPYLTYFH